MQYLIVDEKWIDHHIPIDSQLSAQRRMEANQSDHICCILFISSTQRFLSQLEFEGVSVGRLKEKPKFFPFPSYLYGKIKNIVRLDVESYQSTQLHKPWTR